jgi:hypothetical protein
MTREELVQTIKDRWDAQGSCGSCGWHGLPYEHCVDDVDLEDIETDSRGKRFVRFSCVGEYAD